MGIWEQLNTRTLFGSAKATAEEVNLQEKNIHLQESNRVLLTDVNLINKSLMRDGRAIPGTSQVKYVALDDNSRTPVFTPNAGEVWQLIAGSSIADQSPAQTTSYYLYYQCKDQNGTDQLVFAGSTSSSSTEVGFEDLFEDKTQQFIDENCQVQIKVNTMGSATEYEIKFYAIRVR